MWCRMRTLGTWIAFTVTLFGLVGLCGMFASYAPSVPLERGIRRSAVLDQASAAPDAQALERLRPALGNLAPLVLDRPGALVDRVVSARAVVADEQRREAASIGYRTRLMLGIVTVLAAALASGILVLVRRIPPD